MTKRVRYNGGTESYYGCSEPTDLIVGKEYQVIHERDRGWQTDYKLKGIEGEFNSIWFDKVDDGVYMALSKTKPVIGEKYSIFKVEFVNGNPKLVKGVTSTVKSINCIGNDIYQVKTRNSIYIVQVSND